jgi:D-alanyl-D-alanine carboxypeptidase
MAQGVMALATATAMVLAPAAIARAQAINGFSSHQHDEPSAWPAPATQILRYGDPDQLPLRSFAALVLDQNENITLLERNVNEPRPIASLTKLMTALVTLEADLPFDELIEITTADNDWLNGTSSRYVTAPSSHATTCCSWPSPHRTIVPPPRSRAPIPAADEPWFWK